MGLFDIFKRQSKSKSETEQSATPTDFKTQLNIVEKDVFAKLKPLGFKKNGRTFNRVLDDGIIQVINFQSGQYPSWKNVSEFIGLKIIMPLIVLVFLIFNPLSILVISLVGVCLFFVKDFKSLEGWKMGLIKGGILYFFLLSLYSVSPFLQYHEFKMTRWNWIEKQAEIKKYDIAWGVGSKGRSAGAYANVDYVFSINYKSVNRTEKRAQTLYYPYWFGKSDDKIEELKDKLSLKIKKDISEKDYVVLVNPKSGESKLFISKEKLLVTNSRIYDFMMDLIQAFGYLLVIIIVIIIFSYIFTGKK